MGYSVGLILSMLLVIPMFVFSLDLITVQSVYSELDSIALTVSYMIAKDAGVKQKTINFVESYPYTTIEYEDITPMFGDVFSFTLMRDVKAFIISKDPLNLKVERSTVIGYYN